MKNNIRQPVKLQALLLLLVISLLPIDTIAASTDLIGIQSNFEGTKLTTDTMTVFLDKNKPHFIFWYGNVSNPEEKYHVEFSDLKEFFGSNSTLDSEDELGGVQYDLLSGVWLKDYEILDTEAIINLTLTNIANNAEIQFISHIYTYFVPIEGTDQLLWPLSELKIDIIIKNWQYSFGAQGLALKTLLYESEQDNIVLIRNVSIDPIHKTKKVVFESSALGYNTAAFFKWSTFASVYNGSTLMDTINVNSVILNDGSPLPPGAMPLWLTYQKTNDSLDLVHDPSIFVASRNLPSESQIQAGFLLKDYLVLSMTFSLVIFIIEAQRRKKNNDK